MKLTIENEVYVQNLSTNYTNYRSNEKTPDVREKTSENLEDQVISAMEPSASSDTMLFFYVYAKREEISCIAEMKMYKRTE